MHDFLEKCNTDINQQVSMVAEFDSEITFPPHQNSGTWGERERGAGELLGPW